MTTSTPKKGYDTWIDSTHIHKPHGSTSWLRLLADQYETFVWLPMPDRMKGRTIASATLTGHAHGTLVAQTLTLKAVGARWGAGSITWNNQPSVFGVPFPATAVISGAVDGDEIVWDVTSLVQAVADGTIPHFGWRVTTDAATEQKLVAFNSGELAWTLEVEFDETPDAPTALVPNGTVVGAAKPVVSFDFTEYGAAPTDLASVRVEVDLTGDTIVDWDSGWVTVVSPTLDLAAQGMTGTVSAGDTIYWRASVQDSSGRQSDPSDWVTYTYQPLGSLTLDSPAAGVLYDPTSEVIATMSGPADLDAYLIEVTDGDDRTSVRFSSKKQAATDPAEIAFELPLKNDDGSRIFTDDLDYQIHVRAWDTFDRQPTPGLAAHVDLWATVHFDDDVALDPVTTFQVKQIDATPFVQLTWTDVAAADAYVVSRDSVHIARLDPADTVAGVSAYSWIDTGAAPAVQHVYELRRLTDGVGRSKAKRASIKIDPEGVWLLRDNGDYVVLDGTGIDQLAMLERRLNYTPLNLPYTVDILTAYEGLSGPLVLSIEDDDDRTVAHAKKVLDAIKRKSTETVQFIAASVSKPVRVKNLEVIPDPDYRGDMNRHVVRFSITQVGDFDFKVG